MGAVSGMKDRCETAVKGSLRIRRAAYGEQPEWNM